MSPEDLQEQRERGLLIFSVPELSSRMLGEILKGGQQMAELVAERVGRPADDAAVRVFIGAVLGAALAAILPSALDPNADFVAQIDASLALLEAGLPL